MKNEYTLLPFFDLHTHLPEMLVGDVNGQPLARREWPVREKELLREETSLSMQDEQVPIRRIISCHIDQYESVRMQFPEEILSVGIHPWYIDAERMEEQLALLSSTVESDTRIWAIGEAGIDGVYSTSVPVQQQVKLLEAQWQLSVSTGKPIVLHIVRAWSEVLSVARRFPHPTGAIVHGFRGRKTIACALLEAGFFLSVHPLCSPEVLRIIYEANRLLVESDTDPRPLFCIYRQLASSLSISVDELREYSAQLACRLFPWKDERGFVSSL